MRSERNPIPCSAKSMELAGLQSLTSRSVSLHCDSTSAKWQRWVQRWWSWGRMKNWKQQLFCDAQAGGGDPNHRTGFAYKGSWVAQTIEWGARQQSLRRVHRFFWVDVEILPTSQYKAAIFAGGKAVSRQASCWSIHPGFPSLHQGWWLQSRLSFLTMTRLDCTSSKDFFGCQLWEVCWWTQDTEGTCHHQCMLKCDRQYKAPSAVDWKIKEPTLLQAY